MEQKMQNQDDLFLLIKALTKSEKKFFTQYVNIYEKNSSPTYLKLFEFLNEQEEYDEQKIFRKFRDPQFRKTFPVTKHYLKSMILKTLRHTDLTVRDERDLTVAIIDIKRLMAKGLFAMAKKMIEKLKEEAAADEKFHDIIHLISMQRSLISMGYYKQEPEMTLDRLDNEEEIVLDKMKQLRQVMNSTIQLYSLMHYEQNSQPEQVQEQIEQLGKRKYLSDYQALASAKARHTYLQFWSHFYCATNQPAKYTEYARRKLEFVQNESLPPTAAANWIVLAHDHILDAGMLSRDFSEFENRLQELEKLKLQSPFHQAEQFQSLSNYGLLYYIRNFDAEKLEYYTRYSLQCLETYKPFIRKVFAYKLRTIIAYAYLKLNKLDESWREISELTALTNGETRRDYVGHVKIINLMLRHEMKEDKYVALLLKNTYRFFLTYLYTSPVHKVMVSYMKEALKVRNAQELAGLNKNYLTIVERLQYKPTEADTALMLIAEDYLKRDLP